eukprot:gnl/TRDRNA2_/TRDRNA2_102300_c2_seq1.p1 gnl/TRDRNA2_/TRDRNA2_102300_c2~~gnl/TRDRNA2_/TRDRNA2_102300_c2_seq1.p1  ORF type:complete len:254 (-),score=43.48 gnl/TRDRNA2_/TRDRNA2_102300_c2_seq1:317-1033(-)
MKGPARSTDTQVVLFEIGEMRGMMSDMDSKLDDLRKSFRDLAGRPRESNVMNAAAAPEEAIKPPTAVQASDAPSPGSHLKTRVVDLLHEPLLHVAQERHGPDAQWFDQLMTRISSVDEKISTALTLHDIPCKTASDLEKEQLLARLNGIDEKVSSLLGALHDEQGTRKRNDLPVQSIRDRKNDIASRSPSEANSLRASPDSRNRSVQSKTSTSNALPNARQDGLSGDGPPRAKETAVI